VAKYIDGDQQEIFRFEVKVASVPPSISVSGVTEYFGRASISLLEGATFTIVNHREDAVEVRQLTVPEGFRWRVETLNDGNIISPHRQITIIVAPTIAAESRRYDEELIAQLSDASGKQVTRLKLNLVGEIISPTMKWDNDVGIPFELGRSGKNIHIAIAAQKIIHVQSTLPIGMRVMTAADGGTDIAISLKGEFIDGEPIFGLIVVTTLDSTFPVVAINLQTTVKSAVHKRLMWNQDNCLGILYVGDAEPGVRVSVTDVAVGGKATSFLRLGGWGPPSMFIFLHRAIIDPEIVSCDLRYSDVLSEHFTCQIP
jgi:hypothetical protein